MIAALLGRLKAWLLAGLAFLAAAAAVYLKGRAEGRAAEKARQARQAAREIQSAREVEDEIARFSPDQLDRRFDRWVRDD